ncbi:MAG: hypothetical protein HC902_00660 [Calothrix sp. SM1_5_4]|nr:hypothetical protein [Calothrix sp. SM1_5_4]
MLFDSKRVLLRAAQPDVMRPILSIPFDPRWIHNLLFEEPIRGGGWSCKPGPDGYLSSCRDSVSLTAISWGGRRGEKRSIHIEHPRATLQIQVTAFKPKVEDRKNLFMLEAPEGYQKFRVR